MSRIIVLDSGPLGMIINPNAKSSAVRDCQVWLQNLIQVGCFIVLPEIADYEVRRELLRTNLIRSIQLLDQLKLNTIYLPITTEAIMRAAELWAVARQTGQPTADPKALDGDVILAAQVLVSGFPLEETTVATTNAAHIARFVPANHWQNII